VLVVSPQQGDEQVLLAAARQHIRSKADTERSPVQLWEAGFIVKKGTRTEKKSLNRFILILLI